MVEPDNLVEGVAISQLGGYGLGVATVSERLRLALKNCGESHAEVSRNTQIQKSALSRFAAGAGIQGSTVDILAKYLGLELVRRRKGAKRKGAG